MIVNGRFLTSRSRPPIVGMATEKLKAHGTSYGLSEAGYDIRLKQDLRFFPEGKNGFTENTIVHKYMVDGLKNGTFSEGRFTLASAIEEFQMPPNLMGVVHDKSTWARQGLSVFNTIIEPGWEGFLTLELDYKRPGGLLIPAGSGIAQVIFHQIKNHAEYNGKYQNQADQPVEAIFLAK